MAKSSTTLNDYLIVVYVIGLRFIWLLQIYHEYTSGNVIIIGFQTKTESSIDLFDYVRKKLVSQTDQCN
jgi:hypothetical protein